MGYRWVGEPLGTGSDLGLGQEFPTRVEAEAWLTESYADLEEAGVDAVTLMDADHVVYGPMSLHA